MKQKLYAFKFSGECDPKKLRISTLDHTCVRIIKEKEEQSSNYLLQTTYTHQCSEYNIQIVYVFFLMSKNKILSNHLSSTPLLFLIVFL